MSPGPHLHLSAAHSAEVNIASAPALSLQPAELPQRLRFGPLLNAGELKREQVQAVVEVTRILSGEEGEIIPLQQTTEHGLTTGKFACSSDAYLQAHGSTARGAGGSRGAQYDVVLRRRGDRVLSLYVASDGEGDVLAHYEVPPEPAGSGSRAQARGVPSITRAGDNLRPGDLGSSPSSGGSSLHLPIRSAEHSPTRRRPASASPGEEDRLKRARQLSPSPAADEAVRALALPAFSLITAAGEFNIEACSISTPVPRAQRDWLQHVLTLRKLRVTTRVMDHGMLVRFDVVSSDHGVARVMAFLGTGGQLLQLMAQHQGGKLDLYFAPVLGDEQWLEQLERLQPDEQWRVVRNTVPNLASSGPTLAEIEEAGTSTASLVGLVRNMASGRTPASRAVCDALHTLGSSAATVRWLPRPVLLQVLQAALDPQSGRVPLALDDLRHLPHKLVNESITRAGRTKMDRASLRAFVGAMLPCCTPPSPKSDWQPLLPVGVRGYEPRAPELAWLLAKYRERARDWQLMDAKYVLHQVESRRSSWDRDPTLQDVLDLTRSVPHGMSPTRLREAAKPNGFLHWLNENRQALSEPNRAPAGPPLQAPELRWPDDMPPNRKLRQLVSQASERLQGLCSATGLATRYAERQLRLYASMLCQANTSSLRQILFEQPEQREKFATLPAWMAHEALKVLDEDHEAWRAGKRGKVLQRMERLPTPMLDWTAEAVSPAGDLSALRAALINVREWPLYGARTPSTYKSPLWLHQQLLDKVQAESDNLTGPAATEIRSLLRQADEHWRSGVLGLPVQALLLPDEATVTGAVVSGQRRGWSDPATRAASAGRLLLLEQGAGTSLANVSTSLKLFWDMKLGAAVIGEQAIVTPELSANIEWLHELGERLGVPRDGIADRQTRRALDTVGLWMRHLEHRMPNLLHNPVETRLRTHEEAEDFLAAVHQDVEDLRGWLETGAGMSDYGADLPDDEPDAPGEWVPPDDDWRELHRPRGERAEERLRRLGELAEPRTREAFECLHELAAEAWMPENEEHAPLVQTPPPTQDIDPIAAFWTEMQAMGEVDLTMTPG